jgi:putative FmdB family regulatory protein
MPTYQYACTNRECGNQFELVQSFTDPAASTCPVCEQPVRKVFGSVGVVFKGSGFYRTDSRAAASSGDAKAEGKPAKEKTSQPATNGSGIPTKAAAAS